MIKPNRGLQVAVLGIGFLFLYIPIISLVVYSFNESQLVSDFTFPPACARPDYINEEHSCRIIDLNRCRSRANLLDAHVGATEKIFPLHFGANRLT